jgi:hypothetical protein
MQKSMFESELLAQYVNEKKLAIAGGVYNLESGRIDIITSHLAVETTGGEAEHKDHAGMPATLKPIEHKDSGKMSRKAAEHEAKKDEKGIYDQQEQKKEKKEVIPAREEKKETSPPPSKQSRFEKSIRVAYDRKLDVLLKKTMLMHDERDRCATDDCKKIAAGERIKLDAPVLLSVMGRPQLRVRYKGRPYYISADMDAIELIEN